MPKLQILVLTVLAATALTSPCGSAQAESSDAEVPAGSEASEAAAPKVGLDRLLRLPGTTESYKVEEKKYGGISRSEWEARFQDAESGVVQAKRDLTSAQKELDEVASEGGGWSMAPPGASNPDAGPASYELLQKVRTRKEDVAAAERRRTELTVEASLAGVPEDLYRSGAGEKVAAPGE